MDFKTLKGDVRRFAPDSLRHHFGQISKDRISVLSHELSTYITDNLPKAFERRSGIQDYRTNPYVIITAASVMGLAGPKPFADFLFNSKLYMALETSFGKNVETTFVRQYPIGAKETWASPREKLEESKALKGLTREKKAQRRLSSVWREIDTSCYFKNVRYLIGIKSGPNTINDTQVDGMTKAILNNHAKWLAESKKQHKDLQRGLI